MERAARELMHICVPIVGALLSQLAQPPSPKLPIPETNRHHLELGRGCLPKLLMPALGKQPGIDLACISKVRELSLTDWKDFKLQRQQFSCWYLVTAAKQLEILAAEIGHIDAARGRLRLCDNGGLLVAIPAKIVLILVSRPGEGTRKHVADEKELVSLNDSVTQHATCNLLQGKCQCTAGFIGSAVGNALINTDPEIASRTYSGVMTGVPASTKHDSSSLDSLTAWLAANTTSHQWVTLALPEPTYVVSTVTKGFHQPNLAH
eukprot:2133606-Rhodomonas_salina.1